MSVAPPTKNRELYELSPSQAYHWALTRKEGANGDMVIVLAILIRAAYEPQTLHRTVLALVEKHATLRCRFQPSGRMRVLTAAEPVFFEVVSQERCEAVAVPAAASRAYDQWYATRGLGAVAATAVAASVAAHKSYCFDLQVEAPIRATVVDHGDRCMTLVLGLHHAAVDAHSLARPRRA